MQSKLVIFIFTVIIIALLVAVLAMGIPAFGTALHDFGNNTLGPTVMAFFTFIFVAPHVWGAETLLYGAVVTIGTIFIWSLIWILVLKRAFSKAKVKLGLSQATQTATPTNYPTMTTPQTVVVKEVPVSTVNQEKKTEQQ